MKNYRNLFNNKKKIAFVIGGDGLIGREICKVLEFSGSKVISLDRKYNPKKRLKKKLLFKRYFDCSDYENLKSNFEKIIFEFGTPNIFINASYPRSKDWKDNSFDKITKESFQKNIELHLFSYSWLAKHAADQMKLKRVKGSIIQLSSIYGVCAQDMNIYKKTNMKESMTYSIIKGGINQLTKQMASYYGKYGIRVNAICPGGIREKKHNKIFIKNYLEKVPLKKFCTPKDVAASALFLSSDASSYITGSIFMVDGGWTII